MVTWDDWEHWGMGSVAYSALSAYGLDSIDDEEHLLIALEVHDSADMEMSQMWMLHTWWWWGKDNNPRSLRHSEENR